MPKTTIQTYAERASRTLEQHPTGLARFAIARKTCGGTGDVYAAVDLLIKSGYAAEHEKPTVSVARTRPVRIVRSLAPYRATDQANPAWR